MGACNSHGVSPGSEVHDVDPGREAGTACPVSGQVGECPVKAQKRVSIEERASTMAAAAAAGQAKKGIKIMLSDLAPSPEVMPSQMTLDDLDCISALPTRPVLSEQDIVTVKGAWNRTLAWRDMTMEALVYRWILLDPEVYNTIQVKFDEVGHDLFTIIDLSVRALDPSTEVPHRESYTAGFPACITRDFDNSAPSDIMTHYTLLGIRPKHWITLKDAFMFVMKTHNPYCYKEHDGTDLEKGDDGAIARFFHIHIVHKAHVIIQHLIDRLRSDDARVVQSQAHMLKHVPDIGQEFYKRLLSKFPELTDYFVKTDMDHLAQHLTQTLAVVGTAGVGLRDAMPVLMKLAHVHQEAMVPTDSFGKVGEVLVEVLGANFELKKDHVDVWCFAYMYCATVISAPMGVEERLYADAEEFFTQIAKEQEWSEAVLSTRLSQVRSEISSTGTYRHTTEELQLGARLSWRNAPKCIGRIAWDTLLIRDCRHVNTTANVFEECKEHLRVAANGGIIQSTMTVFAPRKANEQWGMRFWNTQFCRYAGYKQPDGSVLGDPANVEFTEMAMNRFGWKGPPKAKRTKFDPLPQILQLPGKDPVMCEFPRELYAEIPLTHPKYPKFAKLGLKWTSLPCINNFTMSLGGVDYPCCPFNGWFCDLEIARNLVERYDVGPDVAKVCGFDTSTNSTGWRSMVIQVVAAAVTHSFHQKKFSVVDHYTLSTQFLTHVDRERSCGREVPAQWSWIGGFAGVHCPVWHYEMRDFYVRPQYKYNCDKWVVELMDESVEESGGANVNRLNDEEDDRTVLILYASTTGSSQQFAQAMARELGLGYHPQVMELNRVDEKIVQNFTHVVCFVATFNNGVAPLNGDRFPDTLPFKFVYGRTGKPIRYAIMALGSTVYPRFCGFGKKVDKTLEAAGGKRFVATILADECLDQAADFRRFLAGIRNELEPRPAPPGAVAPELQVTLGEPQADAKHVDCDDIRAHVRAKVSVSDVLLRNSTSDRSTRKICIDISGCEGMSYRTGGHLSVLPCNPHEEILKLAAELDISEAQLYAPLKAEMVEGEKRYPADLGFAAQTLYETLKWHLDIGVRSGNLERTLRLVRDAGGMTQEEYVELMTQDKEHLAGDYWWLANVLQAFPKARGKIALGTLFTTLPPQHPRLYSIASSNLVSPSV
mmetsp:Transcript_84594/g.217977  ORF Transcript_84594/g.217977 Transcript_84594/m.217977 type:complete len:1162 (+) Transcript_84594:51-3536(+)